MLDYAPILGLCQMPTPRVHLCQNYARHPAEDPKNPLSMACTASTGATTAYASCGVLGTLMATDWPFAAQQTAPVCAACAHMPQNGRKGGGSWLTHEQVPLCRQGRRRGGAEGHRGFSLEAGPARTSPDASPHALMGLTSRQVAAPRRSMRTEGGHPSSCPLAPAKPRRHATAARAVSHLYESNVSCMSWSEG